VIIECALEVKADLIVSGDKHLLALKKFKGIRIKTSSDVLRLLE
jgi:predicted nucleic acid-binding protein